MLNELVNGSKPGQRMNPDNKLLKSMTFMMEEYGMPKFTNRYPSMDILKLVKDAGYSRPEPRQDKFCGIQMDDKDVEKKLLEYGYVKTEPRKGMDKFANEFSIAHIIAGTKENEFGGYTKDDLKKAKAILSRFTLPAEVKWPVPTEHQCHFISCPVCEINQIILDCISAFEEARKG